MVVSGLFFATVKYDITACIYKNMKKLIGILLCACSMAGLARAEDYNLGVADINIRDPYVFADKNSGKYYMPASLFGQKGERAFKMYESKDLKKWRDLGVCFRADADFWGKRDFWAPDMFEFGGKYYIIATFSPAEDTLETLKHGMLGERGCSVLVADRPEGPYRPLVNKPFTPKGWMCLDATLFEEDGQTWALYCREWMQIVDGSVVAQKMGKDLKNTEGDPMVLFYASAYPHAIPSLLVTDAPVANRADDGTLYMTWSTFDKRTGKYIITAAISESGKIAGPWKQLGEPLNPGEDGGHAMVFKTFDGKTMISYHSPNGPLETFTLREFKFENGRPVLGEKLN